MKDFTKEELERLFQRREQQYALTIMGQRRHGLLFEPYNISPTEFRTLAFLYFAQEGAEPSVVADSMKVLRQTMTKVVDALERKNLAVRSIHPTDRRRVFIHLLPEGAKLARELLELETDYNIRVESHFTEEEMEQYRTLFAKMQGAREEEIRKTLDDLKK